MKIQFFITKILSFLFLTGSLICLSQNIEKADSLSELLSGGHLSKAEQSTALKLIAYYHPEPRTRRMSAKRALESALEVQDIILQAEALEELSHIERKLGNNERSFDASLRALQIYEDKGLVSRLGASYNQLALNYLVDEDYASAIRYLKQAASQYIDTDQKIDYASTLINLGEAYRLVGRLDTSAICFEQALSLNESLKINLIEGYCLGNLGMIYSSQKKLGIAKETLNDAIGILNRLNDPYSTSVYLAELGEVYQKEGDLITTEKKYKEALDLAKNAELKEQIRDFSQKLADFYERKQHYQDALLYQKIYQTYQDSLVNKENVQTIERLKAGYEFEKKDKEIAYQQIEIRKGIYERNITLVVVLLLIVILVISIVAYRRKQKDNRKLAGQKNEISRREEQKNWLLGELQHRTKNNLQMISSLLNMQSRKLVGHPSYDAIKDGKFRVDALAIIHQRLYQEEGQLKINLHDYLNELVSNLVFSFNKKVSFTCEIDSFDVDVDKAVPLALIINELVTNALKHAYEFTDKPELSVKFAKHSDTGVGLEIADNGKGLKAVEFDEENSFGFRLVKSFVAQLRGTIQQKNIGMGCKWNIKFNLHAVS